MELARRSVQIYSNFEPFTIHAHKGGVGASHYPGTYFKHFFDGGGGPIVGKPDGSILLKPKPGQSLWGMYPVAKPRKAVGNKEPFLNPTLAVLNPPAGSRKALAKRRRRGWREATLIRRRGSHAAKRGDRMSRRKHHYSRNPLAIPSLGSVKSDAVDGAAIAAGLVGTTMVMPYLPLPAMFQAGIPRYLAKGAVAYVIGRIVGMVGGKNLGRMVTLGGIAGVAAEAAQGMLSGALTTAAPPKPGLSAGYAPQLTFAPRGFADGGLSGYTGTGLMGYTGTGLV